MSGVCTVSDKVRAWMCDTMPFLWGHVDWPLGVDTAKELIGGISHEWLPSRECLGLAVEGFHGVIWC